MAWAILYCEVCHQNVALNDNFCSHRGIQLPSEELLIKYYFSQGYKYFMMLEFLHRFHGVSMCLRTLKKNLRDVTRTLIGGGGGGRGVYSYIHVLPDGFLLNLS